MWIMPGNIYASVLPEPVLEIPIRSCPLRIIGNAKLLIWNDK